MAKRHKTRLHSNYPLFQLFLVHIFTKSDRIHQCTLGYVNNKVKEAWSKKDFKKMIKAHSPLLLRYSTLTFHGQILPWIFQAKHY
uniref:Putative ovule protein n=1 Tax=Solanum chacoense TaxID=4108 RepID=A0A0V0IM02_SOLCH